LKTLESWVMNKRVNHRRQISWALWFLVGAGVLAFCGANAHLVYVAVTSQPDCVAHLKEPRHGSGIYRAAQSDC
jgi:hypothetical protein